MAAIATFISCSNSITNSIKVIVVTEIKIEHSIISLKTVHGPNHVNVRRAEASVSTGVAFQSRKLLFNIVNNKGRAKSFYRVWLLGNYLPH